MDLNKYAEMVSGCDFCEIYESSEEKGIRRSNRPTRSPRST